MTVALYARRKGWPLEEVIVSLSHSRVHAADCAECETKAGRLDRVTWTVTDGDRVGFQFERRTSYTVATPTRSVPFRFPRPRLRGRGLG